MKWIGQHIYDLVSRFRNDIYLEDISSGTIASGGNLGLDSNNKIVKQADTGITDLHGAGVDGSANQLLTDDGDGTVTSESTLTYDAETLTIGADDDGIVTIQRLTHSDGDGGHLKLAAGKGTGNSKMGGDIHLYGGQSTGNQEGGDFLFSTSTSDGSADANANSVRQVFQVTSTGAVSFTGSQIGNAESDNDLSIVTDGSMQFVIDRDNDETSQLFAWTNYTTEIMNLDESGNLQIDGGLTTGSTSFVNSSGVVQVATQGTIDHDSLANFVAAEHYDWSSDISGTATIHANNITDLHGAGVSGAANQLLTDDGDGTVTSESELTYDSETLTIGADDDGAATIKRTRHSDEAGGDLYIRGGDATGTDKEGGALRLYGGRGTSNAVGGAVTISTSGASGSSGSTLHTSQDIVATFKADKDVQLTGNLIFEGPTPDSNETTFSITDPTADRTITVPDATGTMALTGVTSHYQYISFLSNMTTASNWGTVSNNGISNHSWNQSLGTSGTTVDSSTGTVPVATIVGGIVAPYDCTLVGFKAIGMGGSNHQYELGLMVGVPTFNDYASFDVTLRAYKAAVAGSPDTNYQSRPIAIEDLTRSYSITAGHVIYPCVKSASGSGANKVSWTIVLKTLIPS